MQYTSTHETPFGNVLLTADDVGLTGLWIRDSRYYASNLENKHTEKNLPVFESVKEWLDIYFSGNNPGFTPPIHLIGTPFQLSVWKILQEIPYGKTTTYGKIAKTIAEERGIKRMAAQAVGGAVGRNPVSIIVPCHRVIGTDGSLVGYGGGIDKKIMLLRLEGIT